MGWILVFWARSTSKAVWLGLPRGGPRGPRGVYRGRGGHRPVVKMGRRWTAGPMWVGPRFPFGASIGANGRCGRSSGPVEHDPHDFVDRGRAVGAGADLRDDVGGPAT